MDGISFNSEVRGTGGTLGSVSGMVADEHTHRVDQLLVKHGFVFAGQRLVPLTHVSRVENAVVYTDLDQKSFETMEPFSPDAYRASDPDYVGPPAHDHAGAHQGDFELTVALARNPVDYSDDKPLGYPGGETLVPRDKRLPILTPGTPVLDSECREVGQLSALCIDPVGVPIQLSVGRGVVFKHDENVPLEWFDNFTTDGVTLKVNKEQLDALFDNASKQPAAPVAQDPYAVGTQTIVEDS